MGEGRIGVVEDFYVVKRYLAYQAEPPFAAISGTELFSDSRVDSVNMLCALT